MEKIKCSQCIKEFKNDSKLKDHWNRIHKEKNFREFHPLKCKYCFKIFFANSFLGAHTLRCEKNPRKDEIANNIKIKLKNKATGKKHSEETKAKISLIRKKFLEEHPEKVPYRLNHSSKDSYPEILFEKALQELNLKGWYKKYPFGIYEFDFAFPHLKIDIEIDGETHNQEKVKQIDKRRDENSKSKDWIVLRFTTKEIKNNLKNCLEKVLNEIKKRDLL